MFEGYPRKKQGIVWVPVSYNDDDPPFVSLQDAPSWSWLGYNGCEEEPSWVVNANDIIK